MWIKSIFILLLLICLNIILWYIIFYTEEPIIYDGITNLFIVLFIAVINIVAGLICFKKKKWLAFVFFLNSILVIVIMNFLLERFSENTHKKLYQSWEFSVDNKNYIITRYIYELDPAYNNFSLLQFGEQWTSGVISGIVTTNEDSIFFHSDDSCSFFIYKNHLYNYNGIDSIEVKKK